MQLMQHLCLSPCPLQRLRPFAFCLAAFHNSSSDTKRIEGWPVQESWYRCKASSKTIVIFTSIISRIISTYQSFRTISRNISTHRSDIERPCATWVCHGSRFVRSAPSICVANEGSMTQVQVRSAAESDESMGCSTTWLRHLKLFTRDRMLELTRDTAECW